MLRLIALSVLTAGLLPGPAVAQQTRAELLNSSGRRRAGELHPYQPGKIEKALLYIDEKRLIERWGQKANGAYPIIADFTTGSGLALGIGYRHTLPGTGRMLEDRTSVIGSPVPTRRSTSRCWRLACLAACSSCRARPAGGITPRRTFSVSASRHARIAPTTAMKRSPRMARRGSTSGPGSPSARSSATCVPTSARAPTIATPRSRNSSPTRKRPA